MNKPSRDETDEDLRLLFQRTGPRAEPVDVEQLLASTSSDVRRPTSDGQQHKSQIGWRTAAFVAIAASLTLLLAIPFASTDSHAFAQVKEQVERVRTVDYVQTSTILDALPEGSVSTRFGRGEDGRSVLAKQISDLEGQLADSDAADQSDIQLRLSLLKPYLGKELPEDIRRVRIKEKHLERTDFIFPSDLFHYILNAKTGQHVFFDHKQKTKEVMKTNVVINRKTGKTSEHAVTFSPAVDFFKKFRVIPVDATERLPQRTIDGRDAIGYRRVQEHEHGTWTTTYWVDTKSNLPVRIVTVFKSTREGLASSRWIKDRFVFDGNLDEALFSTETPDGYKDPRDGKIYGFEL